MHAIERVNLQGMAGPARQLSGGRLLAEISRRLVGILRDNYGRGPMKAKTYAIDDLLVVVMRSSGLTALEQTFVSTGDSERVAALRLEFQRAIARHCMSLVEELTDRRVLAFLPHVSVEPDITVEIFVLDRPLEPEAARALAGSLPR